MNREAAALNDAVAAALRPHDDVLVGYLFGSSARGTAGPLSDVDVAVLLDGVPARRRRLDLLADMQSTVAAMHGHRRVDLVVLNDAPVALGYRVVAGGVLLVDRDEVARIRHAATVMDRWLDMAPLRREFAAAQHHRLVEGRFGRR